MCMHTIASYLRRKRTIIKQSLGSHFTSCVPKIEQILRITWVCAGNGKQKRFSSVAVRVDTNVPDAMFSSKLSVVAPVYMGG